MRHQDRRKGNGFNFFLFGNFDSFSSTIISSETQVIEPNKGRSCIRPEVSRTSTFGKVGVSNGQFFDMHLAKIHENKEGSFIASVLMEHVYRPVP